MCIPSPQQCPKLQDLQHPTPQLAPPLHPGSSTPLPHRLTKMARWRFQPLSNMPQGHQDPPTRASLVVCGALITATATNAGSCDLHWEGSEGVGFPWRRFLFVFRTICTAQVVLECVFLAVAGEVPLQLSTASQTQLAQGRAFQNVLCSNRKAAECYSSQKSAALVLF